jgi:hypothetical protein
MNGTFTVEETNLACIYGTESRASLIQALAGAITGFDTGDPLADAEMFEIALSALDKASKLSDAEFAALELIPEFEDYDEQEE